MGKFMVRSGELAGRKFRLEPGARIVIGRELADLNFPDKRMSRKHCALEARDDGDYVEDLGSTNGVLVNGAKVAQVVLKRGDVIKLGFTDLEFLGMPETSPAALEGLARKSASQTLAFRAPVGLRKKPASSRDKLKEAKFAAMGKEIADPKRRLISAKGKFCEACGEAIFMKEGALDEGKAVDGLYLCRLCALIAEKQKDLGGDYLPSYAKIAGGRLEPDSAAQPEAAPQEGVEIVEATEISLDDLAGETQKTAQEAATTLEEEDEKAKEEEAPEPVGSGNKVQGESGAQGSKDAEKENPQRDAPEKDGGHGDEA